MNVLVWGLFGYLAGSFPSAWLTAVAAGRRDALSRARRSSGAGDAHVVLRESGAGREAAVAATIDVLKALIPTVLAVRLVGPYEAAACGVGAVAGHCWPPILRDYAGRGLAAAAGASLALLPIEMFVGGAVTGLGTLARRSGSASTAGFLIVPLMAMWRREPLPYRFAAWVVFVLIVVRRLEGVAAELTAGAPAVRTVWGRAVFDRAPPARDGSG